MVGSPGGTAGRRRCPVTASRGGRGLPWRGSGGETDQGEGPLGTGGHAVAATVALVRTDGVGSHATMGAGAELAHEAQGVEIGSVHPAHLEDVAGADAHAFPLCLAPPVVHDRSHLPSMARPPGASTRLGASIVRARSDRCVHQQALVSIVQPCPAEYRAVKRPPPTSPSHEVPPGVRGATACQVIGSRVVKRAPPQF